MATAIATPKAAGEYELVSVALIEVEKDFNNRRSLGSIDELADSIRSVGLLQPLLVRPWSDDSRAPYVVVAGHRRLAAAKKAGLAEVPVIVVDHDVRGRLEALLVENLHRLDIDALEEAEGYRRLTQLGLSQKEIASKVGRSQAHVSKRMGLLGLVPEAAKLVNSGGISLDKAIELAKIAPELQAEVLEHESKRGYGGDFFEYSSPARVAQEITQERALAQRKKDSAARAKKEGVQLLKGGPFHDWSWNSRAERPLGHQDLKGIKVAEHKTLKCHRAYIDQKGALVYACADPASHMSKAEAKKWKERHARNDHRQQEVERKERLVQLQAIKVEREQLLTAVLPKLDRASALKFALETLIRVKAGHGYDRTGPGSVLRLLGENGGEKNQLGRLYAYCNKSEANLLRATVALSYVLGVEALDRDQHYDAHGTQYAATLAWLQSVGYAPTELETNFLERVAEAGGGELDVEDHAQCRICGCTDDQACEGGCSWVEDPAGLEGDGELCSRCLGEAALELREEKEGPLAGDISDDEAANYLGLTLENARAVLTAPVTKAIEVYKELLKEQAEDGVEVIVKPDDEHSGGWTATINGQGAESTQTAEVPLDASDGGSVAPAPLEDALPVPQHACRSCGSHEGPWAEMVEPGWLCVDCDSTDLRAVARV